MTPSRVNALSQAAGQPSPLSSETLFPWQWLLRALEAAFQGNALGLCFLGVLLTTNWGTLGELVIEGKPLAKPSFELTQQTPDQQVAKLFPIATARLGAFYGSIAEPLSTLLEPSLLRTGEWRAWAAGGLLGIWRLVVWSLLGVAVARITAEQLTHSRRFHLEGTSATVSPLDRARRTWFGLAITPLVLIVMIGMLLLPIGIAGYLIRGIDLPILEVFLWPFATVLGILAALIAGALVIGAPLLWAASAVERPDPFDAVSRTLSYVYQAPVRLAAYAATAIAIGITTAMLLEVIGAVALLLASVAYGNTSASLPFTLPSLLAWSIQLITNTCYASYFWAATTAIYFLLRRDVDDQPLDEIDLTTPSATKPVAVTPATAKPQAEASS